MEKTSTLTRLYIIKLTSCDHQLFFQFTNSCNVQYLRLLLYSVILWTEQNPTLCLCICHSMIGTLCFSHRTMQRSRFIISCLLALVLGCESMYQKLKSLNDLKNIDFGQSMPKHSLLLLHWFANAIDIDNNNVLCLTFDPNTEDFGSHHYGNYEELLDPLPWGYRYYTVGNLYEETSHELPDYVLQPPVREYRGNNMDRIIFRIQETNSGSHRIDQAYLTQHYRQNQNQGTMYNPDHTYRITANLLQQMRLFSVQNNHRSQQELRDLFGSHAEDSDLRDIRNKWGNSLACLGLLLFIVIQEKYSKINPIKSRQPSTVKRNTRPDFVVNIPDEMNTVELFYCNQLDQVHLEIITGKNGQATIVWRNVPMDRLHEGVAVVLFKHQADQEASNTYKLIQTTEGSYDTSVPLTEGQQVRLHKARRRCLFWTKVEEELCRGPTFTSPDRVLLAGYNAYLQLFVRDGKACARLYVKKSFRTWKSEFDQSWVGFYDSAERDTHDYKWWQWQWATKFQPGPDSGDYKTFEYCSGVTITRGVQARFILKDYVEIACSPTWQ